MDRHTESVEREILLEAPPEDVWEAVADPGRAAEWFGARVTWDLEPGGRATFTFPDGRERPARVDAVEEGREVVFHYLPVERDVDGTVRKTPGSTVEITLEPHGRGTRVRVVETTTFLTAYPRFLPEARRDEGGVWASGGFELGLVRT